MGMVEPKQRVAEQIEHQNMLAPLGIEQLRSWTDDGGDRIQQVPRRTRPLFQFLYLTHHLTLGMHHQLAQRPATLHKILIHQLVPHDGHGIRHSDPRAAQHSNRSILRPQHLFPETILHVVERTGVTSEKDRDG